MKKKFLLPFCCLCSSLYAQQGNNILPKIDTQSINEVVITGQYAPSTENNAVQKIQVIDRKKIDAMAAQTLRDVLTNQMNVHLSQDAILGSSMSLQGMSGQDVKILMDGVPLIGRHNGNIDISQIDLHSIERIEIIEGPMAVSYGTDAIAGTINLISNKSQYRRLNIGASSYNETIGTSNLNAHIGIHKDRHTLLLSGGRNFFAGWSPNSRSSLFDFRSHAADSSRYQQWKPREQYTAGIQYTYKTGKTSIHYSGNFFSELITDRGMPDSPFGETTFDGYYRTQRIDNTVFLKSELANHKLINWLVSYNTYSNIDNSYLVDLTTLHKELSNTHGNQDTSRSNQLASRATFSSSDPSRKVNYEIGYDLNIQHANGSMMKTGSQAMGDYAAFASAEYKPVDAITIRPGLRYSYNTGYNAPLIPSINLLYKAGEHVKIRASYARGFRAPSLQELYFYFKDVNHNIIGNTSLHAESSDDYNITVTYANNIDYKTSYKIEAGGFYNNIHDLITLAETDINTREYTYVNIGKYRTKGLQVNAQLNTSRLQASAGASYTGTYNGLSEAESVPAFSYSPEVRANVSYTFASPGITASVFYKYTGRQVGYVLDEKANLNQTFIDPYSILDLSASRFFIGKRLNVAIGCKNLLNIKNVNAFMAGSAHSTSSSNIPIATGRYYYLKLDLNINSNK